MELLKERIKAEGRVLNEEVLKVDSFLNHRVDPVLMRQVGEEFARIFAGSGATLVATIESSGIGIACCVARHFGNVPVIFAKKGERRNIGSDVYTADVYSFTHQKNNVIRVSRKYLKKGMRVLIIDDFLANGGAINGLMQIIDEAEAVLVGAGVCIEKGWQPGGDHLRGKGVKLVSLAICDRIENGRIIVRD